MIQKLEFPAEHHRFLSVELGWLDTFTEEKVSRQTLYYELACTMYNYLMAGIVKSNSFMRKRRWTNAKEVLDRSLGIGIKLLDSMK